MMITPQILCIPPYLSSPWKQISYLYAIPEGVHFQLVVILANHIRIVIPNMDRALIDTIFEAHARYAVPAAQEIGNGILTLPSGIGGLDLLNFATQHNPDQMHSPDLPKEVLEKITGIAKVMGPESASVFQKPEPHCNCPYCQVARAFHDESASEDVDLPEIDLAFRSWNIRQTGEKLYEVTNPLDEREHYSVYLGEPLGCTCGHKNCEHIRAVLNS